MNEKIMSRFREIHGDKYIYIFDEKQTIIYDS